MSEAENSSKRGYRKITPVIVEAIKNGNGVTPDEVAKSTGLLKWYCVKKMEQLKEKGKLKFEDGKYFIV